MPSALMPWLLLRSSTLASGMIFLKQMAPYPSAYTALWVPRGAPEKNPPHLTFKA